mmetsp:Transcript_37227/g.93459  ORF Transcript_37227/g.93459 Transcript_37227/m.93459 type:complete len:206 (+) Transcript_37227:4804-5421(+)
MCKDALVLFDARETIQCRIKSAKRWQKASIQTELHRIGERLDLARVRVTQLGKTHFNRVAMRGQVIHQTRSVQRTKTTTDTSGSRIMDRCDDCHRMFFASSNRDVEAFILQVAEHLGTKGELGIHLQVLDIRTKETESTHTLISILDSQFGTLHRHLFRVIFAVRCNVHNNTDFNVLCCTGVHLGNSLENGLQHLLTSESTTNMK